MRTGEASPYLHLWRVKGQRICWIWAGRCAKRTNAGKTSSDATQEFEVPDSTWQRIAGFARRRVAFSQVWCLSILREILTCLWQSRIEKQSHKHWRARSQKKKCRTLKRNGEWEDASGKFYGSRETRQPLERQCIWPRWPRTPNSICSLLQLHPYRRSCSLWGIRRLYFIFSL